MKKLFALASITALTGAVAIPGTGGCSSTEVVTIPADSGTSGTTAPKGDGGKKPVTPVGDDDDDDTPVKTCLSEDPIDQTQLPYTKSIKVFPKNTCSAKELAEIGAYYKAHVSDADFTTTAWKGAVSEECAKCVFTEESDETPATEWGPIIVKAEKLEDVNRGGCIETVSGKEACGRAYQQYQTCLLQACLIDCKTQQEFTDCRGDQKVLTTSCKDAGKAVKDACGTSITAYETACKGASYTFDGPIKVLCMNGPKGDGGVIVTPPKDAGPVDAAADADATVP